MDISNFRQIFAERILKQFEIKIVLLFYLVENSTVNVPIESEYIVTWPFMPIMHCTCKAVFDYYLTDESDVCLPDDQIYPCQF